MDEVDFYLEDLKSKFLKINPSEYFLSYSGGRDSHFLLWFIKEWLYKNDNKMWLEYKKIPIISVNTRMEHPEILRRMIDNSDIVLLPKLKPFEIKEKVGSPCFSKIQDQMIMRYQNGLRSPSTMQFIMGSKNGGKTMFKLNNTARTLLLSNKLHKISDKCCYHLKKRPMAEYRKKTKLKTILAVRGSEGLNRKSKYKSCFNKDKSKFTPIWDLTENILKKIEEEYKIEVPNVYKKINRTGCIGCPYGSYMGDVEKELSLLPNNRLKFVIEYFKESYDVLNIDYNNLQTDIYDFIGDE